MDVQGHCDDRFAEVAEEFERNFAERGELGASVGRHGRRRDRRRPLGRARRPRADPRRGTRTRSCVVMSSTKGATALARHLLASAGELDLDEPVADVLARVRGRRQGGRARPPPAHPPGRPARPCASPCPPGGFYDWDGMVDRLAAEAPVLGAGHPARLPRPHLRVPRRRGGAAGDRPYASARSSPTRSPARSASTCGSGCRGSSTVGWPRSLPPPAAGPGDPIRRFMLQAMTDPTSIPGLVMLQQRRLPRARRVGLARPRWRPSCRRPAASTNARALAGLYRAIVHDRPDRPVHARRRGHRPDGRGAVGRRRGRRPARPRSLDARLPQGAAARPRGVEPPRRRRR